MAVRGLHEGPRNPRSKTMKKPKVRRIKDRGRTRFVVKHEWFSGPRVRIVFTLKANAFRYAECVEAGDSKAMLRMAWTRDSRSKVKVTIRRKEEDPDASNSKA